MNAFCTGCSPLVPIPSTLVTCLSRAALAGMRQLTTGLSSSRTVQAPQTPPPQTSLVPVSPPFRTTSISIASSSATVQLLPLITRFMRPSASIM